MLVLMSSVCFNIIAANHPRANPFWDMKSGRRNAGYYPWGWYEMYAGDCGARGNCHGNALMLLLVKFYEFRRWGVKFECTVSYVLAGTSALVLELLVLCARILWVHWHKLGSSWLFVLALFIPPCLGVLSTFSNLPGIILRFYTILLSTAFTGIFSEIL